MEEKQLRFQALRSGNAPQLSVDDYLLWRRNSMIGVSIGLVSNCALQL